MTDPASPASVARILELGGGVTMRVHIRGEGAPLVLLHGFTGDASTMYELASRLTDDSPRPPQGPRYRTIVPDLVGHGGSRAPDPDGYSVDAMVGHVLGMLDRVAPEEAADVVGYSMGGRVALTLACDAPDRVRSVCLIGASAGLASPSEREERVAADEALADFIEHDGLEAFVDRWMANPLFATQSRLGDDALSLFRTQRLGNDGAELARSLRAAGTGRMRPLHDSLATCAVPMSFIVGADDAKFREIADDLVGRLPQAAVGPNPRVEVVERAGHAAHLEQPAVVAGFIRSRVESSPTTVRHELRIALRAPLATARGATRARESVLLAYGPGDTMNDRDASMVGWGEASPLPGWSAESLADCRRDLPFALHLPHDSSGSARPDRFLDRMRGIVPAARAAIVGAALDAEARHRGVLLCDLLAEWFADPGQVRRVLGVNTVVSVSDPDEVGRAVAAAVAAGMTTVKLKVAAESPERDVARIAAARDAGPGVELRIDANGGWDERSALDVLRRLAPFDIALCEEPVRGIAAIAAVGAHAPVPVAVDESVRTVAEYEEVWRHAPQVSGGGGTIHAVVVKPQALGGPDVALAVLGEASRRDMPAVVTTMIDSAVGVAHAVHVAAAAGLSGAHGLATSARMLDDVADIAEAFPIEGGRLRLAADDDPGRWGAGLGIGPVSPGGRRFS